jgi:hypothetical protein
VKADRSNCAINKIGNQRFFPWDGRGWQPVQGIRDPGEAAAAGKISQTGRIGPPIPPPPALGNVGSISKQRSWEN